VTDQSVTPGGGGHGVTLRISTVAPSTAVEEFKANTPGLLVASSTERGTASEVDEVIATTPRTDANDNVDMRIQ
jgi:hypothetical protein